MGYRAFVVMAGMAIVVGITGCAGVAAENAAPDSAAPSVSATESPTASPTPTETATSDPTATATAAIGPDGVPARLLDGDCTRLFNEDELESLLGKPLKAHSERTTSWVSSIETQHGIACDWGDLDGEKPGLQVGILPRVIDGVSDEAYCPAANWPESSCVVVKAAGSFSMSVLLVGGTSFDAEATIDAIVDHLADSIADEQPIVAPLPATTLQWDKSDCLAIREALQSKYDLSLEAKWVIYTDASGEGTYFDDAIIAGSGSAQCDISKKDGSGQVQLTIAPDEGWTVDPDILEGTALEVPNADVAIHQSAQPKPISLGISSHRIDIYADDPFDEKLVAAIVAEVLTSE